MTQLDSPHLLHLSRAPLTVRWGDLDAFNHVNNSVYATYLEEARLHWWRACMEDNWFDEHSGPVIAALHINYRVPIAWPAQLWIDLFLERQGKTSVTLAFSIRDQHNVELLYADGNTTLVWVNRQTGKTIHLPDNIKAIVQDKKS